MTHCGFKCLSSVPLETPYSLICFSVKWRISDPEYETQQEMTPDLVQVESAAAGTSWDEIYTTYNSYKSLRNGIQIKLEPWIKKCLV